VLDTSGGESLGAGLGIPGTVVDLVGVTLRLEDGVTRVVVDVDLMFVVEIDSGDPALSVDCDSSDTTSALGDLDSLLLLTGVGVPGEDGGLGADLTGDSGLSVGADADAHDIIGVMLGVVGNVLGGVVDLATTEECLGVGCSVENDTEGGSHVDGLTLGVPVDVLSGVGASVTIDVLESVGLLRLLGFVFVVVGRLLNLA